MNPQQATHLRELCLAVDAEQKTFLDVEAQIEKLGKHIEQLEGLREQAQGKVAYAIGGRDAVAKAFLPQAMTLSEAWETDYKGLQTGHAPKLKGEKGPKMVDSDDNVAAGKKA